jgi:hypothetical protein
MSKFWLNTDFWGDPTIRLLTPAAKVCWLSAVAYCSRHRTDGVISEDVLASFADFDEHAVDDLNRAGLLLRGPRDGLYTVQLGLPGHRPLARVKWAPRDEEEQAE